MDKYFFIGIKGTGMAALASMLHDLGYDVEGSDQEKHFFTEEGLHERGIVIHDFDPANIKDNMHVVIGNAFLEDFPEVIAARNNPTCECARYHEFVGKFLEPYALVAAAGSHGYPGALIFAQKCPGGISLRDIAALYGCKDEFLGQAVHGCIDRYSAVRPCFRGKVHCPAPQNAADIGNRVIGFHLFKEDVPHLIVGAQVLDLPYQLVLRHYAR